MGEKKEGPDGPTTNIAVILGKLVAAFPNVNFPKASVILYREMLADIPVDVLDAAVGQVISEHVYNTVPTIAEIRQAAAGIVTAESRMPSAYEAWAEVKGALHEARPGAHVWSTLAVGKAIDQIGGLQAFGASDAGDEVSWRAQFVRAYEVMMARGAAEARMLPQVRAMLERNCTRIARKNTDEEKKRLTAPLRAN